MKLFSRLFAKAPQMPADIPARTGGPAHEAGAAGAAVAAAATAAAAPLPSAFVAEAEIDLETIDDPARIAELVVEGRTSSLRQRAADRIVDPALLRALLRRVRGSDKAVYKILKQKCDALNAEQRRSGQFAADVRALCESLERHAGRTPDGTYAATLDHLVGRWQALTPAPDPASQERWREAVARCRERSAERARQIEAQESRRAAALAAAAELERERQTAREAAARAAEAEARARAAALEAQAAAEAARLEKQALQQRLLRQLGGLIRRAHESLRDGNTQQAAGLRRAIAGKWPADFAAPAPLVRHLQQLDDRLAELKGWKDYAVAPKRLELITEMESLVGSEEEPQTLARRIQALQAEWRTISKGLVGEAPDEWERFHQASQAAYQPCSDYFERQAGRRRDNLENRRALLGRLTAFAAAQQGEQTDWRLVNQVLREAPLEWRRYFPVAREPNRPLQADFETALARLQGMLDAWHERNEAAKTSLIKRARHVATEQDTREAIEAVRRLQLLWKETGQASHARDQALWAEFREVCDAVYQRRDQAHADYTAGLAAAQLEGERLCEEAERQAAAVGPDPADAAAKIPVWRAAFEGLPEMPRTRARAVQDRFEQAILRLESEIARARARNAERAVAQLFEALHHIRAYEWSQAEPAEERAALKRAAEQCIARLERWPKGARALVNEVMKHAENAAVRDPGEAEKALRVLCIRAEIRGDRASPEEDAPLRRQYQVQRLMSGMGRGSGASHGAGADGAVDDDSAAAEWDALLLAWIPVGGVDPAVHAALQARFIDSLGPRPVARPPRTFRPRPDAAERRDPHARSTARR